MGILSSKFLLTIDKYSFRLKWLDIDIKPPETTNLNIHLYKCTP